MFGPASIVWPVLCLVSGVSWGASIHLRWRAFSVLEGQPIDSLAPQQHGRLLDLLQHTRLPADAVAKLVRWLNLIRVFIMTFPIFFGGALSQTATRDTSLFFLN